MPVYFYLFTQISHSKSPAFYFSFYFNKVIPGYME